MQVPQQLILQIVGAVKPMAIWALTIFFISTGVALFLKNILESLVSYFLFMINKRLGINVRVEVRGAKGTISAYNKRWIFVKTDDDGTIIIPIKNWQSEKWILLEPTACCKKDNTEQINPR